MSEFIFSKGLDEADDIPIHSVRGMVWLNKAAIPRADLDSMKWELEITGKAAMKGQDPPFARLWIETPNLFGVPRFYGFRKFGYMTPDQERDNVRCLIESGISLRDDQPRVFAEAIAALEDEHGGIIEAPCAFGKTVLGIKIAEHFGTKTLVIVDKSTLVNQWTKAIQDFCPGVVVGRLQGKQAEWEGCQFVVATIHSLTQKEYPPEVYESFGLVISDEVHRMAAPTWNIVAALFPARLRVGLSATPERGDRMSVVFRYHIGRIVSKGRVTAASLIPSVYMVDSGITAADLPDKVDEKTGKTRRPNVAHQASLISALAACKPRTELLVKLTHNAQKQSRRSLVLSHRKAHLLEMHAQLVDKGVDAALFMGTTKLADEERARDADVILGTWQKAKEGISIDHLDTLIFATPGGSVKQAAGRILRECPDKKSPLIVDVTDHIGEAIKLRMYRLGQYKRLGYPVHKG